MKYISIVNWEEHQHYSDRNVIWIKLYTKLLTSYKLRQLSIGSSWFYVQLLLLAPAKSNLIPLDIPYLAATLHIKGLKCPKDSIKKMVKLGLITITNDSEKLSKCYQDACIEEKERKKERTTTTTTGDSFNKKNKRDGSGLKHISKVIK